MQPYYYFNRFEEARWPDEQKAAAERAELYFGDGDVPDLVDRARLIEIERSLTNDDWAEVRSVDEDFTPWTAPVPDDAVIQCGDPSLLSPDDELRERALAELIAWANRVTPWETWLWDIAYHPVSSRLVSVPGDPGDLTWDDGRIWINDTTRAVPLADQTFWLIHGGRDETFAYCGQTYRLIKDVEYKLLSCDQDYVEPFAPAVQTQSGKKVIVRWHIPMDDLAAWGDAKDWSKGIKEATPMIKLIPPAPPPPEIAEIRHSTGLSQAAFAARHGIPLRTVEAWERGIRRCSDWLRRLLAEAEGLLPPPGPPYGAVNAPVSVLELRQQLGLSRADFSARHGIPYFTIRNWDEQRTDPPPYVLKLLTEVEGLAKTPLDTPPLM